MSPSTSSPSYLRAIQSEAILRREEGFMLILKYRTRNNYQINFRSTEKNNMGILAQSPRFNVTKVAKDEETG
jgi:hypothetical protein